MRSASRSPRDDASSAGYSLVEVMVAMTVLVVISIATIAILMGALEAIRGNSDRVKAASIARTKLAELRTQGADAVAEASGAEPLEEVDYRSSGFTVTTTSRWVGFDEDTNPCASVVGGSPTNGYVQARISVLGGELTGPQYLDGIVTPTAGVAEAEGGAVTVYVRGEADQPLAGREVTATSTAPGAETQIGLSGPDGCLHFAHLVPGAWTFTVTTSAEEMLQPGTDAARDVPTLAIGENAAVDPFVVALPVAGITLTAGTDGYPLPGDVPVAVEYGALGPVPRYEGFMPNEPLALPEAGQRLWPDPLGYDATLGCSDADAPTHLDVTPGGETVVELATARVDVVGPEGATASVQHAEDVDGTGLCSGTTTEIGVLAAATDPDQPDAVVGPSGRAALSLPAGTWTFSVPGEDDRTIILESGIACSVHWPPPPEPEPTPTPTPTATEAAEPSETPTPQVTLPPEEPLFDQCPGVTP